MRRQRLGEAIAARKRHRLNASADEAAPRAALENTGALCGVAGFLSLHVLTRFVTAAPQCNRAVLTLCGTHVRVTLHVEWERMRVGCGATARQVAHFTLEYRSNVRPLPRYDAFGVTTLFGDTPHAQMPNPSNALVLLDDATRHMTCLRALTLRAVNDAQPVDLRVLPRCRALHCVEVDMDMDEVVAHARPLTQVPSLRVLRCWHVRQAPWTELCAQPRAWTRLTIGDTHNAQSLDGIAAALPHLTRLSLCVHHDTHERSNENAVSLAPQLTSLTLRQKATVPRSMALAHFVQHDLRAFVHLTALHLVDWMDGGVSSDDMTHAFAYLPRLQRLHVEGSVDNLAFLSAVPHTVRKLIVESTTVEPTTANVLPLFDLVHVQHLTLIRVFSPVLTELELLPFQPRVRARALPQMLTFACT